MRSAAAWMFAASLALAGCGLFDTSPCDKADDAVAAVTASSKGCSGVPVPALKGKSECQTALKGCSDLEKATISEEMDCLKGVSACVSGKEQDWTKSVVTCAAPVAALSDSCKAGFGLK
jgi:hypothetical protein